MASSSSPSWKYDVFLSFRGEDTRKTFVDHLYSALNRRLIRTYKDDETLPRTDTIGPSLLNAIDDSQIALIIFSENYANSSWCLDELEYIMKCNKERGQIVMPVFYHVDPSEVRQQKQKYEEAFAKHESENSNKVESWRKALVDASNISGWETKHIANGHEAKGYDELSGLDKKEPMDYWLNGLEAADGLKEAYPGLLFRRVYNERGQKSVIIFEVLIIFPDIAIPSSSSLSYFLCN